MYAIEISLDCKSDGPIGAGKIRFKFKEFASSRGLRVVYNYLSVSSLALVRTLNQNKGAGWPFSRGIAMAQYFWP